MKHRGVLIVLMAIFVAGCSGIRVHQDYDPSSDLGGLTTFAWVSETQVKTGDPRIDNPLRDDRIRWSVEHLLHEKGYGRVEAGTPSFYIRYRYGLRQKIESRGTGGHFGFGMGSSGHHGGAFIGTGTEVEDFDEGTLIIDFLKDQSGSLLWRGNGIQRFTEYSDPGKSSAAIHALVEKILDQFPPPLFDETRD